MVAEKGNEKLGGSVLKDKPQIPVPAAFEKLAAQLAYAETAVHVRLPAAVCQVAKSEKAFHSLVFRQFTQSPDDSRVYGEKSIQAVPEALRPWSS